MIRDLLQSASDRIDDAARQIFYAESHIKDIKNVKNLTLPEYVGEVDKRLQYVLANLELALARLGIYSPEDVGLSSRALNKEEVNDE